jgi:hypothetical protein
MAALTRSGARKASEIVMPTWPRWLATVRSVDPGIPDTNKAWDLSFREELHAIDAVAAGQGILARLLL